MATDAVPILHIFAEKPPLRAGAGPKRVGTRPTRSCPRPREPSKRLRAGAKFISRSRDSACASPSAAVVRSSIIAEIIVAKTRGKRRKTRRVAAHPEAYNLFIPIRRGTGYLTSSDDRRGNSRLSSSSRLVHDFVCARGRAVTSPQTDLIQFVVVHFTRATSYTLEKRCETVFCYVAKWHNDVTIGSSSPAAAAAAAAAPARLHRRRTVN